MARVDSSLIRARTWVLLAIDAADRAGLTPIPKARFHQLMFLSNCLAELFEASPPAKRVIKYRRGPFYPDVQWQLDRLNAMGLVAIGDISVHKDKHGPWMEANYSLTEPGIKVVVGITKTHVGQQTVKYINELVFAFARIQSKHFDLVALNDLNYSAAGISEGALITFGDARSNLAIRKTEEFEALAPEILKERVREKLQLYLHYIEPNEAAA